MTMTLERKWEAMQELGDVFLQMAAPFCWVVIHTKVLIMTEDGGCLTPEGSGTNPYDAVHNHFRELTEGRPLIQSIKDGPKVVRWNNGWEQAPGVEIVNDI